jgi:pyrimidine-specific ribonucleoside hydrolase
MDPRRVIIDTDPGIDDSAAIFFALRSPELRVECLTTVYGNAPIGHTSQNAIRILEAAGWAELPIYVGAGRPLVRERPRPGARPKLGPKAQAFVVALACT